MIFNLRRMIAAVLAAAVMAIGAAGVAGPAVAQEAETAEFSEQKLQAYAEAAIEVTNVIEEWQPRIQAARQDGDEAHAEELIQEANADLIATIQDADGISFEEYQDISVAAQQDPQLHERLSDKVQQLQKQ